MNESSKHPSKGRETLLWIAVKTAPRRGKDCPKSFFLMCLRVSRVTQ